MSGLQQLTAKLRKDGFVVFKNFLDDPEVIKKLVVDAEGCFIEQTRVREFEAPVGYQSIIQGDRVINNVIFFSELYFDVATSGKHLEVIRPILNDPYYGLIEQNQINFILAQANVRESSSSLPPHKDVRQSADGDVHWSVQCILAIQDRKASNGGLMVVPGSHLSSKDALEYSLDDMVSVDLDQGDMVIFLSDTVHATHSCVADSAWGLLLTYRSWWVKPQFDFVEMFGRERLDGMNERARTLLGAYSRPSADPYSSPSMRKGYL